MVISIPIPTHELESFCRRWKIRKLAFFGSVLRDDFHPSSDIDILVDFNADADWSMLDHIEMQQELQELLEHRVDLITQRGLDASKNWLFREEVQETALVLFEEPENEHASG